MTPDYAPSLLRSFERHLRAENRSDNAIESYLESIRQAEAFLATRGRSLVDARRADLGAFLGDLLQRRAPATAATRYKVLRLLYAWLEEESERATGTLACPGCGSASVVRSARTGSGRSFAATAPRPACLTCTRTSFATRSRMPGSPGVAVRRTLCGWQVGGPG